MMMIIIGSSTHHHHDHQHRLDEPAIEDELLALLKPCPDDRLKIWPVDKKVGNVRNKGAELLRQAS